MKIKYVSYIGENQTMSLNKTHELVFEKTLPLNLDKDKGFEFYSNYSEMLKSLSEGFSNGDSIVLLSCVSEYNKTKSLLFKAMNIKCVKNAEVIALIKANEDLSYLNDKQVDAHSAMPTNSTALVTLDGLFSGFGICSGKQKLVMLPIDETRVENNILQKTFDFLAQDEELIEEESVEEIVPQQEEPEARQEEAEIINEEEGSPVEMPEEKNDSEIVETEQDQPLYGAGGVDDLVAETFTNLGYTQIKIAFGIQEDNITVDEYFSSKIVFRNTGLFTIVNVNKTTFEKDEQKCKADISQIARSAMINANASVGMAVSDVMTDENNKKFVISAMCDARKTNIYKVFALPDENNEDIIISAIGNMFSILNARVMEFNDRQRRKNEEDQENTAKAKKEKKSKAPLIVLLIILFVLLAAVGFTVYCYYSGNETLYNFIESIRKYIFPQT